MFARFVVAVLAMVVVVTASNILVQYPVQFDLGPIHLGDILTWGAFTYPFAFLVSDLTNRHDGPTQARMVVLVGFLVGLALSFWLSTPRIAIASGSAFLIGQLLDIAVFQRLRNRYWLIPPSRRPAPTAQKGCSSRCSSATARSCRPARRSWLEGA